MHVHENENTEGRSSIMAILSCCFDDDAPRPQWENSTYLSHSTPSFLRDRIGANATQCGSHSILITVDKARPHHGQIYVNS